MFPQDMLVQDGYPGLHTLRPATGKIELFLDIRLTIPLITTLTFQTSHNLVNCLNIIKYVSDTRIEYAEFIDVEKMLPVFRPLTHISNCNIS